MFEVKWDGMRALARSGAGGLRLTTRSGADASSRFPEVSHRRSAVVPDDSMIDGELVALDDLGRPSFALLSPRIQRAMSPDAVTRPVTFVVFDLLRLAGRDVLDLSYDERRRLLLDAVPDDPRIVVADAFDDGAALLASTEAQQLEGVIAKRRASRYQPGVRSPDWVKVPHRRTHSYVIGGWKARPDSPSRLASVLVGTPTVDGRLVYDGAVGSGLSTREAHALHRGAARDRDRQGVVHGDSGRRRRLVRWVEPVLVADVEHLGPVRPGTLAPAVTRPSASGPVPRRRHWSAWTSHEPGRGARRLQIDGRQIRLTNLDKVLYPETSTTKAEVLQYYVTVAPAMLPLLRDRPVTRKRWPDGVDHEPFFEKNMPRGRPRLGAARDAAPRRVRAQVVVRATSTTRSSTTSPTLVWLAQVGALELHAPQWRVDRCTGEPLPPDRLVVDLDPGAPAGLPECAQVALLARDMLAGHGLDVFAVTSGSKGMQLYAPSPPTTARGADLLERAGLDVGLRAGPGARPRAGAARPRREQDGEGRPSGARLRRLEPEQPGEDDHRALVAARPRASHGRHSRDVGRGRVG